MLCINVLGTFPPHQVFIKEKAFKMQNISEYCFYLGNYLYCFRAYLLLHESLLLIYLLRIIVIDSYNKLTNRVFYFYFFK